MADDYMDARLRSAGMAWRARTDEPHATVSASVIAPDAPAIVKGLSPEGAAGLRPSGGRAAPPPEGNSDSGSGSSSSGVTLVIANDLTFELTAPCGSARGAPTVSGSRIQPREDALTDGACFGRGFAHDLNNVFASPGTWAIQNGQLDPTKGGNVTLTFER